MISGEMRRFIENAAFAIIATADKGGQPHLALGTVSNGDGGDLLIFENWLCYRTLENVRKNARVAVAVFDRQERTGYQFGGRVVHRDEIAMMDGYQPEAKPAGEPQAVTRLLVRVEKSAAFCEGLHFDLEEYVHSQQAAVTAGWEAP